MSPNRDILDRNLGLLLRHAYVPALPEPHFRQRLLHTLEIEARRLARERTERTPAERPATVVRFPLRRRVATVLAVAAAVLVVVFGVLVAGKDGERVPGRAELVARGDVALQVGAAAWRAASAGELEAGFTLGRLPVLVETPAARPFELATSAGRVELEPSSALHAAAEAEGLERLLLAAGGATYHGAYPEPGGRIALRVGVELRILDGVPETPTVALAGPEGLEDRRPVDEVRLPEEESQPQAPFATLAGDVLTAAGEPTEAFRVGLLLERVGNDYDDPDMLDFEGGAFLWEDIRPGRYRVYVHAAGHAVLDLGWMTLDGEHVIEARLREGGAVRGHVIDEATGNPVPGALVLSEEDTPQDALLLFPEADGHQWLPTSARTLADGSFELEHLNPGTHTLRVNAAGYGAVWEQGVAVAEDSITEGVSVQLGQGGAVEGLVTHPDGSPRVDEQIIVAIWNDNRHPRMNFAACETDAAGRYRVEDLPVQQMLVIQVERRFDARPVVKPVDIVAGETVVIDFLGGVPGTRVFGRVLDRDGRPITHHNVALMDKHAEWSEIQSDFSASTTLSDGSFAFEGIQPGEYLFYMVEEMGRWIRLVDQFEVPAWPELERVVTIAELGVGGRVTDARNGEAVPGCSVVLELIDGTGSVFAGNTVCDEQGRFDFDLLNPGRYRAAAYPLAGDLGFEKSEAFVIDEARRSFEVDLQLGDGAPVEIHVVDPQGAPIAGAMVLIVDEANDAFTLSQFPVTDANGIFRASGVRAGEFKVLAEADGYAGPPVLFQCRRNQNNRVEVTLAPVAPPDPTGEER